VKTTALEKMEGSPSLEMVNLVLQRLANGEKVLSLAIGEPSFDTPPEIINEAYRSMRSGDIHYVSSYGMVSMQESKTQYSRPRSLPYTPRFWQP